MDAGVEGVFEYPGKDQPYPGKPGATFAVALQMLRPVIEAAEQTVGEDNIAVLALVEVLEPSWVVIHADEDGQAGEVLGAVRLEAGVHENVAVSIDRRYATPTLYAVLHEDDGQAGVMEFPARDRPVLVNGKPVVATFAAHYPPYVLVYDQPLIDGTITVDRVISEGPGWVAIYSDQDGQPGLIIGFAALEDGLNEQVRVQLIESAVTPSCMPACTPTQPPATSSTSLRMPSCALRSGCPSRPSSARIWAHWSWSLTNRWLTTASWLA